MNKSGMSYDGREINGIEYLRQRIEDVFKTVKGSIVLARQYGSLMHLLIDENVDQDFIMSAYEYTVEAFTDPANGLDDCKFKSMTVDSQNDSVTLTIRVIYEGEQVTLKGVNYG